jgi:hypothetical protein
MREDLTAFTIRIPKELSEQIEARARINRRNRNGEINVLLEYAIDTQTARDQVELNKQRDRKAT